MTAQGIEAATADKTRSGLAEGESLVGTADAPNSLAKKDISMTDTTDQQAVTVAQEDREAACAYLSEIAGLRGGDAVTEIRDDHPTLLAFARHRLASVSSASAGYAIEQGQPAATAPYACSVLGGRFDESVGEWVMAVVSTPLVTPFTHWWPLPSADHVRDAPKLIEPVPATNQAGEVANPIDSAPKDGTMIRLLVDYSDGGGALEDEHPKSWTIGFNNLGNTGEDEWKFAGWSWEQDVFTQGSGTPVGWLPWSNPSTGGDVQ